MSRRQYIIVKGRKLQMDFHQFPDGFRQLGFRCLDKYCPHECTMSFKMPAVLSSVKIEECAKKLFSHCKEMGKMDEETAKLDGRINLTSLVRSEVR